MKIRILRWLLALGALVFAVITFKRTIETEAGFGATPGLIFSFAALITFVLLLTPEVVKPTCEFFGELLVDVIYPSRRADKPPLSYLLADRYREQMRTEEAMVEYAKILHYYPQEKRAHRELLRLAIEVGDERNFRKYARTYERRFGEPFDATESLPPSAT
jgi:hypothetical protein